jgi:prepilin-type N-terminal cleavage/methylation domain-containing protein
MKLSKNNKPSKKGFTLIELLVVIAIIASLGGLSYGPIMKHLTAAKITKEKKVCKDLVFAITSFEQEYDSLPYTGSDYPTSDTSLITVGSPGKAFLEVLMGVDTTINDKGKSFFHADKAKGVNSAGHSIGGIAYNTDGSIKELRDSWAVSYWIRLDYDADGIIDTSKIADPIQTAPNYETELHIESAIAASSGKDKVLTDKDDAKSW